MRRIFLIICLLLVLVRLLSAASKKVMVDSIAVNNQLLLLSFHAEEFIDEKIAEGLQKGLTSTVEYQIQLWEKRGGLINNLVAQRELRMKIYFDNWEHKYVLLTPEEKRLTNSLATVKERCSVGQNVEIVPLAQLKEDRKYFITISLVLRPLSMENYQEIKNWLSGRARDFSLKDIDDTQQQEKKLKGGLLKMFLTLTGFGDRVVSGQGAEFIIHQGVIERLK
ncbi:MAG: DUF4390 domain-containing protein [candidate division KSB1 bacterium]|nr:DUF4390 domain-containing protein [candidate division KSB1 bacterium]